MELPQKNKIYTHAEYKKFDDNVKDDNVKVETIEGYIYARSTIVVTSRNLF